MAAPEAAAQQAEPPDALHPPTQAARPAQDLRQGQPRAYRQFLFAVVGGAIGAIPAALANESEEGVCKRPCMIAFGAAGGSVVGFLIGRDRDREAARSVASGPTMRFDTRAYELAVVPEHFRTYPGGSVVVGREGLVLVEEGGAVSPRAVGLRGVRSAVALPARNALLVSTAGGLFAFDLARDGSGSLLEESVGVLIEPAGEDAILLGTRGALQRARISGSGTAVRLDDGDRAPLEGLPGAIRYRAFDGVVWVLEEDRLTSLSATGLSPLGSVDLPSRGSSLSLGAGRAVVAAGSEGVFLLDISTPERPSLLTRIGGIPFAYDAVIRGDTLFVAGGYSGLIGIDVSRPGSARVLGVGRDLGFVSALDWSESGQLVILDRSGGRLHVMETRTGGSGSNE